MIVTERDGMVLRFARIDDFQKIDEITVICYKAIHESWIAMQGESVSEVFRTPDMTWEERKTKQNHDLFAEHPEWVWVLEQNSDIIGFVTFKIDSEKGFGLIENNGVFPQHAGRGLGKFMYRHVLDYFRKQGLKVAMVETGLDDPHIPARKAYKAVGFDRSAPIVLYWQDLRKDNTGSHPD
ncbi:MAG: GNAT family N-acetyltransferase [Candidatus Thorarchaeota archaeon]|nr:GNAT family N-acetyltransferase [Candidatus Thorarchaeota archaeon]